MKFKVTPILTLFLISIVDKVAATPIPVNFNLTSTTFSPVYLGQSAHMPLILWLLILGLALLCFFISLPPKWYNFTDMTSALSATFFSVLALTSFFVESWTYETALVQLNESAKLIIQPVVYQLPGWISLIMFLMVLLSVMQAYRVHLIILEERTPPLNQPNRWWSSKKGGNL